MFKSTRLKGRSSEDDALRFLLNKGFSLVSRNYYSKGGEIDLIMRKDDFIVFVEVKSLASNSAYSIYQSLTSTKKARIKKAINSWLLKNDSLDKPWRADFVGIRTEKGRAKEFDHFEFVSLE